MRAHCYGLSLTACRTRSYNWGLTQNPARVIKASRSGLRCGTRAWCFASTSTPSTPTTLSPSRVATARARRSSMRSKSACVSTAKVIASASPSSNSPCRARATTSFWTDWAMIHSSVWTSRAPGSPGSWPVISWVDGLGNDHLRIELLEDLQVPDHCQADER